jgi:hypothetical protein
VNADRVMKAGMMAVMLSAAAALGQASAPTPAPAPAPTQPPTTAPAPAKPKSLDELLGIKPKTAPAKDAGGAAKSDQPAPAADRGAEDLDASLRDATIEDNFESAVDLMGRSALRLNKSGDSGLDTQRLQQDAIKKLDALISQFQKQRDNSPNSSSSSPGQQSSAGQQQQQQQQGSQGEQTRQGTAQGQRAQRDRSSDSNENADAPARRDAVLRPGLEAAKAAWGALPERLRDLLLQGSGEKFSQSYEQLTEEYYKRLAEQKP